MDSINKVITAIGQGTIDHEGVAVAVARLKVEKSYQGIDLLLQKSIGQNDQDAWEKIKAKIDYTYQNLDLVLTALDKETGFLASVKERLERGQKILFKPNTVSTENISPYHFGPTPSSNANTEWPFVAAVLRWFHDKAGISFYQMSLGEAATAMACVAADYSHIKKGSRPVTTEATLEGKSDDFYGGWGFYFVRLYLSQAADKSMGDDPMRGLEESMAGTFLPPGDVDDKLMVYDLNRISDDPAKGRDIPVPKGQNFTSLTLHKAIVGGDPVDAEDRKHYPGAVLINLPRLKVHAQALFTNVIKNLGIGLYPMEAAESGSCDWKYANPHCPVPGIKAAIPHQKWVPEVDPETCLPLRDQNGDYIVNQTGGLTATMLLGELHLTSRVVSDESEFFRTLFTMFATSLRCSNPDWNLERYDFNRERHFGSVTVVAMMMSKFKKEVEDPFFAGLIWGQGKWPSYALAADNYVNQALYGWKYPSKVGLASLYGSAAAYADFTQNGRKFFGTVRGAPNPNGAQAYVEAVTKEEMAPFNFTFYVPVGHSGRGKIPNVVETDDPQKILTVEFDQGRIRWPDARLVVV